MTIKKKLTDLLDVFTSFRGSGTTTLLEQLPKGSAYIISETERDTKQFKANKSYSILNLSNMRGISKLPLLLDNHVVLQLCKEALTAIDDLSISVDDLLILADENRTEIKRLDLELTEANIKAKTLQNNREYLSNKMDGMLQAWMIEILSHYETKTKLYSWKASILIAIPVLLAAILYSMGIL